MCSFFFPARRAESHECTEELFYFGKGEKEGRKTYYNWRNHHAHPQVMGEKKGTSYKGLKLMGKLFTHYAAVGLYNGLPLEKRKCCKTYHQIREEKMPKFFLTVCI